MTFKSHPVAELFEQRQLTLIAGPCVIESYDVCREVAERVQQACLKRGIGYIFKASFDKANRTSIHSYRGPGLEEGLKTLAKIRDDLDVPVLTDIHEPYHAEASKDVVDVDRFRRFSAAKPTLVSAAKSVYRRISKKVSFSRQLICVMPSPSSEKLEAVCAVTERGSTFGYKI